MSRPLLCTESETDPFTERKAARSASAFEGSDDDHAAAAAWAWLREDARLGLIALLGALVLLP